VNHLRRDELLFALLLTALPVGSARAQVAGHKTFPFSKSGFATADVRGRMVAFGGDHAASTPDGWDASACGGIRTKEPGGRNGFYWGEQAGMENLARPMAAKEGCLGFTAPSTRGHGNYLHLSASAGEGGAWFPTPGDRGSGLIASRDYEGLIDQKSRAPGNSPHQPFMLASGLSNLTNMIASDEQTILRTEMLLDTSPSVVLNESNGSQLSNSEGAILVNKKDYPSAGVNFEGVSVGAAWGLFVHVAPRRQKSHEDELPINAFSDEYPPSEGYHWGGLLAQSLFFNVIENSVRTASDSQIRNLLAKKPFWHDYRASIRQFNMRRWNDGDDFLVNYTGHPMQGAVSGFIEIQNDPRGRELEIGANREYWESRFKAFLWATAYSVHSEISPIGEAGIGNEGGWTYPIHCKTHCTEPGTYHHYTNNTGWVDFIITPTLGTLWLLAEDTLDRYISDRIQGDGRFVPKIVRGALNPSRTMANAVRFKAPWYRDSQESEEFQRSHGVHFLPSDDEIAAAERFRRFSIAPYFRSMPFGEPSHPCALCMQNPGVGISLDYAFARWVSGSIAVEKDASSVNHAAGSTLSVGFGLRLMYETPHNTLSFAVRPGLMITPISQPPNSLGISNVDARQLLSVENGTITLALSNDIKLNPLLSMRLSIADTIVRTGTLDRSQVGIGSPPYLSWLSKDSYTNRSTWSSSLGPVLRF
jgi:hypothetical protein